MTIRRGAFSGAMTLVAAILAVAMFGTNSASAEVSELRIARQPGLAYLPLQVMERERLLEKHAEAAGLKGVKTKWVTFAGGNVMNDALLSGSLDIASGGVAPLITLWAKSNGRVRAISSQSTSEIYINTRNPNVKSIKDFTDADRIAMPAVKVSVNAIVLQMAAEQEFGKGNAYKLDPLTVARSYAEGSAALLSGIGEINSAASALPFYAREIKTPGIHTVLKSYDVLGGPATNNLIWTTQKFHDENPKTYAAFLAAYKEAIDLINNDPTKAAQIYRDADSTKAYSIEELVAMLTDKKVLEYTVVPHNVTKYTDFMFRMGVIPRKPDSWKDLFFPEIHSLQGS
ncbi:MAG: ABC transporter substrate-binding protein [Bradyrhizobiaceae bacterium]|nr:MAG: ABC transporter substrate-binding protein [Bradyrhizobiaceae bacterium]